MDRLTFEGNFCDIAMCQETPGGSFCEDGYCSQRKCWERLKQYEDTGISPEQIIDLLGDDTIQAAITIRNMIDNGEFEIIQHLADCYNDGRLVVLPCRDDAELTRNGHKFKADNWNHYLTAFRDAPETKSGKQVALFSIVEAEEALTSMERKEGAE